MLRRTLYTRLFPKQARVDRYIAACLRKLNRCEEANLDGQAGESLRLLGQYSFIAHSAFRAIDKKNGDL